jgi:hypothetical protein
MACYREHLNNIARAYCQIKELLSRTKTGIANVLPTVVEVLSMLTSYQELSMPFSSISPVICVPLMVGDEPVSEELKSQKSNLIGQTFLLLLQKCPSAAQLAFDLCAKMYNGIGLATARGSGISHTSYSSYLLGMILNSSITRNQRLRCSKSILTSPSAPRT